MGFNIRVHVDEVFDTSLWYLSESEISDQSIEILKDAYRAAQSMWNSEVVFIFRIQPGKKPNAGQVAPGVFVCDPSLFQFGDVVLITEEFWRGCMSDKNLVDSMLIIGEIEDGEYEQLKELEMEHCFYCMDVYPDQG